MSQLDFKDMFKPDRLNAIHKLLYPEPPGERLTGYALFKDFFNLESDEKPRQIYALCYESVLKPLSELSLDAVPDLLQYLIPPEDPHFPEQAVGALLLLDQCPRYILKGAEMRWANAFFDVISGRFLTQLRALPWDLRPDNPARWEALGYSFENTVMRRKFLTVPLVHSENIANQKTQLIETNALRDEVEKHFSTVDPYRKHEEEDLNNVLLFPHLIANPPAYNMDTGFDEYVYHFFRVTRAHEPIIRKFGRYPYRNAYFNRTNTPEEEEYLANTNYFATPSKEMQAKLREDFEAGRWTPLPDRKEQK